MARVTAAAGLIGGWLAEDIRGGGVIERVQTVLDIVADGALSGSAAHHARELAGYVEA